MVIANQGVIADIALYKYHIIIIMYVSCNIACTIATYSKITLLTIAQCYNICVVIVLTE